jgi:hypothetical protein
VRLIAAQNAAIQTLGVPDGRVWWEARPLDDAGRGIQRLTVSGDTVHVVDRRRLRAFDLTCGNLLAQSPIERGEVVLGTHVSKGNLYVATGTREHSDDEAALIVVPCTGDDGRAMLGGTPAARRSVLEGAGEADGVCWTQTHLVRYARDGLRAYTLPHPWFMPDVEKEER